jgi:hypothetical protein
MFLFHLLSTLLILPVLVQSNVEKTIFLAPPPTSVPSTGPSLANLCLHNLSPSKLRLRTAIPVRFPNEEAPTGLRSWYLIGDLVVGLRYEVRICWAAVVSLLPSCLFGMEA